MPASVFKYSLEKAGDARAATMACTVMAVGICLLTSGCGTMTRQKTGVWCVAAETNPVSEQASIELHIDETFLSRMMVKGSVEINRNMQAQILDVRTPYTETYRVPLFMPNLASIFDKNTPFTVPGRIVCGLFYFGLCIGTIPWDAFASMAVYNHYNNDNDLAYTSMNTRLIIPVTNGYPCLMKPHRIEYRTPFRKSNAAVRKNIKEKAANALVQCRVLKNGFETRTGPSGAFCFDLNQFPSVSNRVSALDAIVYVEYDGMHTNTTILIPAP